jgi:hypothetical protein
MRAHAQVGPVEEALDGSASTHRWARAPVRGPAAVPSSSSHLWPDRRSNAAVQRMKVREGSEEEKWWALGFVVTGVGFDRAVKPHSRRMRMGGHDRPDRHERPN